MSEMQDIRVWARENGWDVADKGRLPGSVKAAYDARAAADELSQLGQDIDGEPMIIRPDDEVAPEAPAAPVPAERKPEPPARRSIFDRKPKPPARPDRKRVSIENVLSSGWALGAMALARSPQAIPVARVMEMQAPVAGIVGEELLKGTMVDRLLQPLARGGRKAELGMALAGPPLLVGMMTARPELFPVLRPMLKMAMMSWMDVADKPMQQLARRQEHFAERFGDVDLDAMIDSLWADVPVPSEAEEEAIRRARGE